MRWAAIPLAILLGVVSASASTPEANPFIFEGFRIDSSNQGDPFHCFPRATRIYRVWWGNSPYFLVNAGTRLMFFPMNTAGGAVAVSLSAGPSTCGNGFPAAKSSGAWEKSRTLDGYFNVAACDECRYVPVSTNTGALAVFDLGTGSTPSFGIPKMHGVASIGVTYTAAGAQYIIANGLDSCDSGVGIYRPAGSGAQSTLTLVTCLDSSIHPSFGFQVDDTLVYVDSGDRRAHVVEILSNGRLGTQWASWPCRSILGSMLNVDKADFPDGPAWIVTINNQNSPSATVRRMTKSGSTVTVDTYATFYGEASAADWRGGAIDYPYVFLFDNGSFSAHKVLYDISDSSNLRKLCLTDESTDYWNDEESDFNIEAAGDPWYSVSELDAAFSFNGQHFVWARYYTMPRFEGTETSPSEVFFGDDFESGDFSNWSSITQ